MKIKNANYRWVKVKNGETLLEVLIALVVLIIGSVTATSLIITSLKANLYNKDALIALNLAQEGIEYMRNTRDTNWMKFSADTQHCWNTAPSAASCQISNLLAEALPSEVKGYALGDAMSGLITAKLDLNDGTDAAEEKYRIKYFDLTSINSDGLDISDPGNLPGEGDDYDFMGSFYAVLSDVDSSRYYRRINIDYKNIASTSPWAISETTDPAAADMMVVTSTVQWKDSGIVHQVQLSSALTRYR